MSDAATERLFRSHSEMVGLAGLLLNDRAPQRRWCRTRFARFHLKDGTASSIPKREVAYLRSIVCNLARSGSGTGGWSGASSRRRSDVDMRPDAAERHRRDVVAGVWPVYPVMAASAWCSATGSTLRP